MSLESSPGGRGKAGGEGAVGHNLPHTGDGGLLEAIQSWKDWPLGAQLHLLLVCKTQSQSLRHYQETSEPSAAVASSEGLSPAHIPSGDAAHQGTGVHRLQGTLCPQDWSFFQPAAGQRSTFSDPDSTPRARGVVQCIDGPLSLHVSVAGHFVLAIVNSASLKMGVRVISTCDILQI